MQFMESKMDMINVSNENYMQPNLIHPTLISPFHDKFIEDYNRNGFLYVAKKYSNWSIKAKIAYRVDHFKNQLRQNLRMLKHKLLKKG